MTTHPHQVLVFTLGAEVVLVQPLHQPLILPGRLGNAQDVLEPEKEYRNYRIITRCGARTMPRSCTTTPRSSATIPRSCMAAEFLCISEKIHEER